MVHSPSLYYNLSHSLSLLPSLFCRLSFSITDHMHTECIPSSTGSVLKIYSLSQKSYETLLSEYHGSVLALIKANNVNFKRWWSMYDETVRKLLWCYCVLKLSFCCWRIIIFFMFYYFYYCFKGFKSHPCGEDCSHIGLLL